MSDNSLPTDFVGAGTSDAQSGPSSAPFHPVIPAIVETLVESNISGSSDENANAGPSSDIGASTKDIFDRMSTISQGTIRAGSSASEYFLMSRGRRSVDEVLLALDNGTDPSVWDSPPENAPSIAAASTRSRISGSIYRTLSRNSQRSDFIEKVPYQTYTTYTVKDFCASLKDSLRAVDAVITSIKRYGDKNGVPHRFLILQVSRKWGRDFYLRIDRRRDHQVSFFRFGLKLGVSEAKDTVAMSGRLDYLLDHTSEEEAQMVFPTPAPLPVIGRILHEIAAESQQYSLSSENCWFFASIIQEMFLLMFGSQYKEGAINHPTYGKARRVLIKSKFYSDFSSEILYISDAILKITNAINNPTLGEATGALCNVISSYHKSAYHHAEPQDTRVVHQEAKQLLHLVWRVWKALDEHFHGDCIIQGAGVSLNDFSVRLYQSTGGLRAALHSSSHAKLSSGDEFPSLVSKAIQALELSFQGELLPCLCSVKVLQETTSLWELLVNKNPTVFTPQLASSLSKLGNCLTKVKQFKESVDVTQGCITLYRSLIAKDSATYTPHLAFNLTNLGVCLLLLKRFTESRDITQECISLFQSLIAKDSAAYTPCLALNLGYLGTCHSHLKQFAESVEVTQKCVSLYRSLIAKDSATYTHHLAHSLGALGKSLSAMERYTEAEVVTQESISRLSSVQGPWSGDGDPPQIVFGLMLPVW